MIQEYEVRVEGSIHIVMVSDEQQALLAAKAAGRAVVGFWHEGGNQKLSAAEYLVETLDVVDALYLERVVRRHLGLPWVIGESQRLIIREFTLEDIAQVIPESGDLAADKIFYTKDKLAAYIRNQYRFYEYGLWAVIRRSDGVLLGKAGVTDGGTEPMPHLELGYHVFQPYRRQGYAEEACRTILSYAERELDGPVYAVTNPANEPSARLLRKLGFEVSGQRYSAEGQLQNLYVWYY